MNLTPFSLDPFLAPFFDLTPSFDVSKEWCVSFRHNSPRERAIGTGQGPWSFKASKESTSSQSSIHEQQRSFWAHADN